MSSLTYVRKMMNQGQLTIANYSPKNVTMLNIKETVRELFPHAPVSADGKMFFSSVTHKGTRADGVAWLDGKKIEYDYYMYASQTHAGGFDKETLTAIKAMLNRVFTFQSSFNHGVKELDFFENDPAAFREIEYVLGDIFFHRYEGEGMVNGIILPHTYTDTIVIPMCFSAYLQPSDEILVH